MLKYTDTEITVDSQGTDYEEFKSKFQGKTKIFLFIKQIFSCLAVYITNYAVV